jgi:hypothetical protein
MTERNRPDPRLKGLPEDYEWKFRVRPAESEEEFIQRVLAQGDAGRKLLQDPDFNAAYQEILEEQLDAFVKSKPGQNELRDDIYFRVRGIQEIALKFNVWVQMAEQLKAKLAAQESN